MTTKERAINILDEFLRLEYIVDPMCANLQANRISIISEKYWWELFSCLEGAENKPHPGQIGGSKYYITKDEGNLYELGLFDAGKWKEDYIQFKNNQKSVFNWKPVKHEYINCQQLEEVCYEFNTVFKEITYEKREVDTQMILHELVSSSKRNDNINLKFKYKAIDGIKSKLRISNIGKLTNDNHKNNSSSKLVSLNFTNGYNKMDSTLLNIKKWLRVNKFAGTDNYWVEINESDTSKEFKEWKLTMKMEINRLEKSIKGT